MATKNITTLKQELAALLFISDLKHIDPVSLKNRINDIIDSVPNAIDHASKLGLKRLDSDRYYAAGEAFIYNGAIMESVNGHLPGMWPGDPQGAVFQRLTAMPTIEIFQLWNNAVEYIIGDTVRREFRLFESLVDGNIGNDPLLETYPGSTIWKEVAASENKWGEDWVADVHYTFKQVVYWQGAFYYLYLAGLEDKETYFSEKFDLELAADIWRPLSASDVIDDTIASLETTWSSKEIESLIIAMDGRMDGQDGRQDGQDSRMTGIDDRITNVEIYNDETYLSKILAEGKFWMGSPSGEAEATDITDIFLPDSPPGQVHALSYLNSAPNYANAEPGQFVKGQYQISIRNKASWTIIKTVQCITKSLEVSPPILDLTALKNVECIELTSGNSTESIQSFVADEGAIMVLEPAAGLTVTFVHNAVKIKCSGGTSAVIDGSKKESITFKIRDGIPCEIARGKY